MSAELLGELPPQFRCAGCHGSLAKADGWGIEPHPDRPGVQIWSGRCLRDHCWWSDDLQEILAVNGVPLGVAR
jgi:hypothetical protein